MRRFSLPFSHAVNFLFLVLVASVILAGSARGQKLSLEGGGTSVSFPDTNTGSSANQTVQFSVTGALTITGVSTSGDFSITSFVSCVLPLHQNDACSLDVRFEPTAPGRRWSPLVATDDTGVKRAVGLVGNGVGPGMAFLPGVISTVIGNGTADFGGDGGQATSASLNMAWAMAVDQQGNILVSDMQNQRIRKVDAEGTITTVAGDGTASFGGDGGPATSAQLNNPTGLAVDNAGNLYIADSFNGRVRRVDLNGRITTVAGGGESDEEGILATDASLGTVYGVAVDEVGNLYLTSDQRVRKVDANGVITTIAGQLTSGYGGDGGPAIDATLYAPNCLVVDGAGSIYLCDAYNYRVRKIDAGGTITTVAGNGTPGNTGDGGLASSAEIERPYGLALDAAHNLYIADIDSNRIRKVDPEGKIGTLAGTTAGYSGDGGSPLAAQLRMPVGLAVDAESNLYVGDSGNSVVRKITVTGMPSFEFGTLDLGQTSAVQTVVVASVGTADVIFEDIFLTSANFALQTDCSTSTALTPGNTCSAEVTFAPLWNGEIWGTLEFLDNSPSGVHDVALHGMGNEDVPPASEATHLVFATGFPPLPLGGNLGLVSIYAEDDSGNVDASFSELVELVIEDPSNIVVYDQTYAASEGVATFDLGETTFAVAGTYRVAAGSLSLAPIQGSFVVTLQAPIVAGAGMTGRSALFPDTPVGQSASATVTLNITGATTLTSVTAGGDYTITDASSCALDTPLTNGDHCVLTIRFTPSVAGQRWRALVVTDNNGVKSSFGLAGTGTGAAVGFAPGWASVFAGNGDQGYSGDGGPATEAALAWPMSLARDSDGNFFIADAENHVIRKVDNDGMITTVAGDGECGYSGDYGAATSAELCWPTGVAVDAAGNLYIADNENSVIREVDVNGTITTVAGNGGKRDRLNGPLQRDMSLSYPTAVATDRAGNLYIADTENSLIRKLDTDGLITTIAGNGNDDYSGDGGPAVGAAIGWPQGIAVDPAGNVYVSDVDYSVVRKVDTDGIITTFAGTGDYGYGGDNGPATEAQLAYPNGLSVDTANQLLIADTDNCVIRRVGLSGAITTVAGTSCGGEINQANRHARARKGTRTPPSATAAKLRKSLTHPRIASFGPPITVIPFPAAWAAVTDPAGNLYVVDAEFGGVVKGSLEAMPPVDFGSLDVGQTSDIAEVWVRNTGNANLQFNQISVAANFNLQTEEGDCSTETAIGLDTQCPLHVAFAPTTEGTIDGSILMSDNAQNSPQIVSLTGEGIGIEVTDFGMSMDVSSLTVRSGSSGTIGITTIPSGGFSGTITLACSGLPAHTTCSFSPATLDALGDNAELTSTLTVATGVSVAGSTHRGANPPFALWWLAIPGMGLLVIPGTMRGRRGWAQWVALLIVAIGLIACVTGCGTSSPAAPPAPGLLTPRGNYSVTVTATSGATSHSGVVTLVVQ
jgi:sugar lactone lactonase YvrE